MCMEQEVGILMALVTYSIQGLLESTGLPSHHSEYRVFDVCLKSVGYLFSVIISFENRTVKLSWQCLPSVHLAYDAL